MDRSPDFDALPLHVDRERGAALITEFYFPVSPRSLERWPIATRRLNGRAIMSTRVLLGEAKRRFEEAPAIMSKLATDNLTEKEAACG
ncbi:hypothetical protein [Castellaniella sp.]|uniref:hypothetical protein n=1 Tax=Castellaniella sp. TaxID=1955812 RepID=UPI002AFEDE5C|nr:hypothetical protein [Castellaniella sp.]